MADCRTGRLEAMPRKPSAPVAPHFLLDTLARKVVPWVEQNAMQRVVIAQKSWRDVTLPPSVTISHKELVSRRKGVYGPRIYGNASAPMEQWESDDQEAIRLPILGVVVDGHADYQVGNYVLHCPAGTFIFIPPGVPRPRGMRSHLEGENRKNGSCDLMWFSPQGRRIQCWICHSHCEQHTTVMNDENIFLLNQQLINFLDFLHEEAMTRQRGFENLFEAALRLLVLAVYREIEVGRFLHLGVEADTEPAPGENSDPIVRAQEYITTHLAGTLTIDKVSRHVHMSRAHFTRRFHRETGQTFVEYVNARRIEQAKVFLRKTDWSIPQISEFVGLRSSAYFHQLFRRLTGTPPAEYRRRSLVDKSGSLTKQDVNKN